MDKKNTNLDELLKIIAASGAGIPIAGIRVVVKKVDEEEPVGKGPVSREADEEACDCGHGKSCDTGPPSPPSSSPSASASRTCTSTWMSA